MQNINNHVTLKRADEHPISTAWILSDQRANMRWVGWQSSLGNHFSISLTVQVWLMSAKQVHSTYAGPSFPVFYFQSVITVKLNISHLCKQSDSCVDWQTVIDSQLTAAPLLRRLWLPQHWQRTNHSTLWNKSEIQWWLNIFSHASGMALEIAMSTGRSVCWPTTLVQTEISSWRDCHEIWWKHSGSQDDVSLWLWWFFLYRHQQVKHVIYPVIYLKIHFMDWHIILYRHSRPTNLVIPKISYSTIKSSEFQFVQFFGLWLNTFELWHSHQLYFVFSDN